MTYDLLKTAHIIVMAMWLGLKIAMFVLFSWHRSPAVSPDGRRLLGLVHEPVSFGPKIFWMPMLALGMGLAHIGRWGFEGPGGAVVVWLIAITAPVWIGAMGYLMWVRLGGVGSDRARDHASRVHAIDLGDTVLRSAIVVWLGVIAVVSLAGDGPLEPSWLAWKVLLFCLLVSSSLAWKWLGKAIGQARGRAGPRRLRTAHQSRPASARRTMAARLDHSVARRRQTGVRRRPAAEPPRFRIPYFVDARRGRVAPPPTPEPEPV